MKAKMNYPEVGTIEYVINEHLKSEDAEIVKGHIAALETTQAELVSALETLRAFAAGILSEEMTVAEIAATLKEYTDKALAETAEK